MNPEFEVHRLNEEGLTKAGEIASVFDDALEELKLLCPEGRHLAIVKTTLEKACFFAKKAMACEPANQQKAGP